MQPPREIGYFIEEVYNSKRLHSALGYRSSAEVEAAVEPGGRVVTAHNPLIETADYESWSAALEVSERGQPRREEARGHKIKGRSQR